MISLLSELSEINSDELLKLENGHYARRVKSHFQAYGVKYDFCRFFELVDEISMQRSALISVFNSSMVVCACKGVKLNSSNLEDISTLVRMTKPQTVELSPIYADELAPMLSDYSPEKRVEFRFCDTAESPVLNVNETPRLDDVFDILAECFPTLKNSYELWLTDTSHRVRRGYAQAFLVENYTTATIQYIIDNTALIGHVGTKTSERGKHHARRLLYWIGERLSADGLDVILFARSHRVSYYQEIGFEPIKSDIVFERKTKE